MRFDSIIIERNAGFYMLKEAKISNKMHYLSNADSFISRLINPLNYSFYSSDVSNFNLS